MPAPLAEQIVPSTTAVITMELQRGVVGDLATMPVIADAVEAAGVIPATAAVLAAARAAGVTVVHCTFTLQADRAGTPLNAPLIQMLVKNPGHLLDGSQASELVPALGPEPGDLVSNRHHGFSPFTGTNLDECHRSPLGVAPDCRSGGRPRAQRSHGRIATTLKLVRDRGSQR